METLIIRTGNHQSQVLLGESYNQVGKYLTDARVIVVTDKNVYEHYREFIRQWPVIVIKPGERNKTFGTLEYIIDKLIRLNADRSTFILGIGGGIVCDISGFAASIYMRGLRFGFISTSLLSQVDASVGGKNGINFRGYKNMVGVFRQPDFVICDHTMLKTLDSHEFITGFAEVIKAAAIKDESFFSWLEANYKAALNHDPDALQEMIYRTVKIKAEVVEQDEKEKNLRRILNFGHTFGHALEKVIGISHGEAVSLGMVMAAKLSEKLVTAPSGTAFRLQQLLSGVGLPILSPVPPDELADAMARDKKKEKEQLFLVLLRHIGEAVTRPMPHTELKQHLHDLR